MSNKDWLKSVIVYLCITFFVVTAVFVYMSLRGKPQAGLIEVSCSAALFVIFLYAIKKVIPKSVGIISNVLSILLAVIFISANYYLQQREDKNYTIKQILIGDLLAKKFFTDDYRATYKSAAKSFTDKIDKIEFGRTTTEKYTIESPFERPEKMDMSDKPTKLTLDDPYKTAMKDLKIHGLDIPLDAVIYKSKLRRPESPARDNAAEIMEKADDFFSTNLVLSQYFRESMDFPLETNFSEFAYTFDNQDRLYIPRSRLKLYLAPYEEYILAPISKQIEDTFQKP